MPCKLTNGKFALLRDATTNSEIYAMGLNGSIAFKFRISGTKVKVGGMGFSSDIEETKKQILKLLPGSSKLEVEILGGDGGDESVSYSDSLELMFKSIGDQIGWSGEVEIHSAIHGDIHPNFVSLLGSEVENGLKLYDPDSI